MSKIKALLTAVLVIAVCCLSFLMVNAQTTDNGWTPYSETPDSRGVMRFFNLSSYVLTGDKSFSYWEKVTLLKPENRGGMVFDEMLALTEFDCYQKRSRKIKVVVKLKGALVKENDVPSEWEYHDPDSLKGNLDEGICKKLLESQTDK